MPPMRLFRASRRLTVEAAAAAPTLDGGGAKVERTGVNGCCSERSRGVGVGACWNSANRCLVAWDRGGDPDPGTN